MNRKYMGRLFDSIPAKQRSIILGTKIKGNISGFRTPNRADTDFLKNTLRTNKRFAEQFLDGTIEVFEHSSGNIPSGDEDVALTAENFWGLFARKCQELDNSDESCLLLENMLREYERLTAPEQSDGRVEAPKDNYQAAWSWPEPQKTERPEEEIDVPESLQYIGYIQEKNGFYNFWPVCTLQNGYVEQIVGSEQFKEEFPELGNVNFYSIPKDYIKKYYRGGEIYVVSLSLEDLSDNLQPNGDLYLTNYRVDVSRLERQSKIKRLNDVSIYPVLQPEGRIDFSKRTIPVKGEDADINDLSLIEEDGVLYGPYNVRRDANGQCQVSLPSNCVVSRCRPSSGMPNYIDIPINTNGYDRIVTRNVLLNSDYTQELVDKISDQELFRSFLRSIGSRKDDTHGLISLDVVDKYAQDAFRDLPDSIVQVRIQRIKAFLEHQFQQGEIQADVAEFTADLLYRFGDSEWFANILDRILDDKDLSMKIQSFKIVQQRIEGKEKRLDELQRECEQAEVKKKAAEADAEKQILALVEKSSAEVRGLSIEKEQLQREIDALKEKKAGWEKIVNLEHESEVLEGVNEKLREKQRELQQKGKQAEEALQKRLNQTAEDAVGAAFDGQIADQIFQAAAEWNRQNQDETFQKLARQMSDPIKVQHMPEEALVDYLLEAVRRYRPDYTRNEVLNIFINLSQNFLTVFSGEPGTGKTSICNIIAHILGTVQAASLATPEEDVALSRYVPISVERGWTSKRDFIGYYNPLSQTFEKANKHLYDGLRILDAEGQTSQYPFIVLLDEANLSPIEYYWADFMNLCDSGSPSDMITLGNNIQLHIPPTLRFTATINNDDTTERLSPRLLDRAALIRLPDVRYKKIDDEDFLNSSFVQLVSWDSLRTAFTSDDEMDETPREIYSEICEQFQKLRICVSPRVERAIRTYWAAAKKWFEPERGVDKTIIALDYAVVQRLLPKINGSGAVYRKHLDDLHDICEKSNLTKCAKMLEDIIERGQDAMNYYQYF